MAEPSAWAMERAREAHRAGRRDHGTGQWHLADCLTEANAAALDAARAQGRREGLEEAAKLCDERYQVWFAAPITADGPGGTMAALKLLDSTATAIRNLNNPETKP